MSGVYYAASLFMVAVAGLHAGTAWGWAVGWFTYTAGTAGIFLARALDLAASARAATPRAASGGGA